MKVLVLTNMLPTAQRPLFGTFVQEQVEDLANLGVDVSVLFIDGRERTLNYVSGVRALRRAVSRERFDIIHAHYGLTGALALTQQRAPVVTTFHGSDCSGEIPWQRAVSWAVARACTPVFVSEELAASIGCYGAAIVPAAVDLARFRPRDRLDARRRLAWPADQPTALLLGSRSNPVKNAALFDAAIDHARHTIGDLRGASLDGLARDEVALAMNAADVGVMTSRAEGSPITIREALASCTPVVSVRVGDVQSVLAKLPHCSIATRDPAAVGKAIVDAVVGGGTPTLRERASEFGRVRIARRVVDVYRDVLA